MSQRRKIAWRKAVAVGWLAASGAAFPLFATAQQNAQQPVPSGAAVEVGGVQARPVAVEGVQARPAAVGGGETGSVAVDGARPQPLEAGRPIVLPNTGRGEASNDQPWLLFLAGLTALVAGTYLGWRASRARVGR